ncbi:MAG: enoyl-CoA hydratase-related protein [Pseudomonadota bacterium]
MKYQDILYVLDENVATITLHRPDNLNGMTTQMRAELAHAITSAGAEARVIILTGAGRGFCSGQDLGGAKSAKDIDLERVLREEYNPILTAIADSPVPIICAVNGPAAGAGANIALSCDIVIAGQSAYFLEAFARIGLIPDAGGTWLLPRKVGMARAMGMALLAEPVKAQQAADWGLIWEVVADAELAARSRDLALRLASGPTRAYGAIRKVMRRSLDQSYEDQLALEAEEQGRLGSSQDFQEGVLAFLEKRRPVFSGA